MTANLKQTLRKNLFAIITISIAAIVLIAFLFFSDSIESIRKLPDGISWRWMLLALGIAAMNWVLEGFALNLICKLIYPQWRFRYSFCIGMVGILYSALTPFSTGGQPMQIYSMHKLGMDTGGRGLHYRCENPDLSDYHGALFPGDGGIPPGIFSSAA